MSSLGQLSLISSEVSIIGGSSFSEASSLLCNQLCHQHVQHLGNEYQYPICWVTNMCNLNKEVEYKRAAPWAEAMFKMHMANMAVVTNFASSCFASYMYMHDRHSESALVLGCEY